MSIFFQKKIKLISAFAVLLILSGCAGLIDELKSGDVKTNTSWTAPQKFSINEIYNAAFKSVSQLDAEIVSHDRETGIISVNRSFPVIMSAIPSQVPITIIVSDNGNGVTLSTTAFLKGMGTASVYQDLKTQFHAKLFNELNITNPQEQGITETQAAP